MTIISTKPNFSIHSSLSTLVDQYEGFIIDQFGVLHDGTKGLVGAADAVRSLKARGKKLIILSNSSKLTDFTLQKLPQFGLEPSDFVHAVTSGQEACAYVRQHHFQQPALFLTWSSQSDADVFLQACGIPVVTRVEDAKFILLHGARRLYGTDLDLEQCYMTGDLTVVEPLLKKCVEHQLPMICANPDFVMVRTDGRLVYMPGTIAQRYEELGGKVTSFGKPNKEHFQACLRELELPAEKVVHVGDSLHHDIMGANAAGLDSIFVAGGVHRHELDNLPGEVPSRESCLELFERHGQFPTHVVPLFRTNDS
ncbi:hypothetical protein FisN_10Lh043 [Fistulifera solaris]|uniref:Uncharacterized protein n=1 Tax=Fistulifera solaris TaxID=1519565 RepID=A0A1Z5JT37_FISSO|nr:hypothetical protein FisN_10Lh043 [Fistulifera solaris]|eukprot:GAX17194.1 hypothetical protein FisN_10Lh043 [Fistulifera solaris]